MGYGYSQEYGLCYHYMYQWMNNFWIQYIKPSVGSNDVIQYFVENDKK